MPIPGIITGGTHLFRNTNSAEVLLPSSNKGVFARTPDQMGATPKYAFNRGTRDPEFRDTMARLFIALPSDKAVVEKFFASVPEDTRPLAKVLAAGGENSGAGGTGFIDFLMTRSDENLRERAQIVNTLTDNYVVFYGGQEAPLFSYSGTVLNSYNDDQRVWLLKLYQHILRGSKLANRGLVAQLRYDSLLLGGYLEALDLALDGGTDKTAGTFGFRFRVKKLSVHTAALGSPTILDTAAAGGTQIGRTAQLADEGKRNATLMSIDPVTAQSKPAADSADKEIDSREQQHKSENVTEQMCMEINAWDNPENTSLGDSNIKGPVPAELTQRMSGMLALEAINNRPEGQPVNPAADDPNSSARLSAGTTRTVHR